MEEVYIFGDQTSDCRHSFIKIFPRKDNLLLQSFLEQASEAIKSESKCRSYSPGPIPEFSTIQELVDRYYGGNSPNPAVESALVCISQLAHFISSFEEKVPSYIPKQKNVGIIGACTGLLAATAIAAADSLVTLIPIALETVRIAFRIGARAATVAEQIEHQSIGESWSTIVASEEGAAQQALDQYHNQHLSTPLNKLWISAKSPTSVTVSGPPRVREHFITNSEFIRPHKAWSTPIYAPYHAPHLHSDQDVKDILREQTRQLFGNAPLHFHVLSCVDGNPFTGQTASEVLEKVVQEIMMEPLRWDQIIEKYASQSAKSVAVFTYGSPNTARSFVSSLKASGIHAILEDQSSWDHSPATGTRKTIREADIAIVGMSGRFPDAANHELFWQLLEKGLDVHRPVPPDRYPVDSHTDPTKKKRNASHTPYGNFITNPGLFDARFFNMSPREAMQTDPMQRLMMTTAYEAMEMAGIVPGRTPSTKHDRIGTFYGQTSDDWREVNAAQDIDTYFISGGVRAFGPGRLNYFFKFSGPSFSVDTACSSSFAAMNVAITSLRAGECDMAITGGANVLTNPDIFSGLSKGHFLSPTGSCKTWDNDADGYCRGDGVCTVIFKRLNDAIADRDPILGVIRGIGTNHSAQAVSITHPCAENQAFLFGKVLKECNVDFRDVSYVEMHGTGTQAGDAIEMKSVSTVFAPREKPRHPDLPLYVGAVKSNIGHGEAVSGVSALIKVLLMLQKNKIPPHTGIKKMINQNFDKDLKERGLNIAFETQPFPRPKAGKRLVFINNFSAAGGNTALLMEDGPEPKTATRLDPRSTQLVTVTAKSLAAFKKNLSTLLGYIRTHPNVNLADLAYTTTSRRMHYAYRAVFTVESTDQLSAAIEKAQNKSHSPISIKAPHIAFAYTGQGSQYAGMGRRLFETNEHFRHDINEFDSIAVRLGMPSIKPLLDDSIDILSLSPVVVQLGMCCIQMALTRLWKTWGLTPGIVIGHSLGEYAALQAAGVLSIADTIYLVGKRAALLESKCTAGSHAMLAVRCSVQELQSVLLNKSNKIEVACINGPKDTVLSGAVDDIEDVARNLADAGNKCTKLTLPYAFHSAQVSLILDDFEQLASQITFHPPRIPVISPLSHETITDSGVINAAYLARHCRQTVDFAGALAASSTQSIIGTDTLWLEIGGHPLCSSMLRACLSVSALPTLRHDEDCWKTISSSIAVLYQAGDFLNWETFHQENQDLVCIGDLPAYGFDEKNFWLQYTGDWLLYKGDYSQAVSLMPSTDQPEREAYKSLTDAVQAIVSEETDGQIATVVAESDLAHPKLWPVVKGHLVNGSALCPSSLYADQAFTLVDYAYKLLRPVENATYNLGNMDNPAPLVLRNSHTPESQIMKMTCRVDAASRRADFKLTSNNGKKDVTHAQCVIRLEDADAWREEWNRNAYLIRSRIDLLNQKMEVGMADKVSRVMAYRLFTALVDYSDPFQGMQSVVFDGPEFEATSNIRFRCNASNGNFMYSPYCIDSAAHLSGFTVNATVNAQEECYISHGWSSMRFLEPFKYDKSYQAYVKMQPVSGSKMRSGDVWIFNDQKEIVGVVGGLRFQCIPRKLMDVMMPKPKAANKASAPPKPSISTDTKPMPNPSKAVAPAAQQSPKMRTSRQFSPKAKASSLSRTSPDSIVDKAFAIILSETAVDESELADEIQWADLGVDSLMSLTIAGKFREELDLDIESSLFTDFASVGSLRKHLISLSGEKSGLSSGSASSVESSDEDSDDSYDNTDSGVTTPDSEYSHMRTLGIEESKKPSDGPPLPVSNGSGIIETIRHVIATEMEMNLEEIADETDLQNLGMDSLMALTVLGKLREEHDIDLDPTMFSDNPSLSHLRKALNLENQPVGSKQEVDVPAPSSPAALLDDDITDMPKATSILLSGSSKTATKNLFLLPDGSGSATSYTSIPAIDGKNVAVYGLNCPFMKDPTNYTCGIEKVSKIYLQEIQRRQPSGPYYLGGWSAGGVVAYEVTRQITELAKSKPDQKMYVEKLVLIDAPCPVRLEPLPSRLHHFFDEIGLLGTGTGKTPSWLLPHFEYSIKALSAYQPELKSTHDFEAPPTLLIWATDGVCGNPDDPRPPPQADEPKSMKWLLDNRTDFGPNGWDQLLGVENCTMITIPGNHFTMMKPPIAQELGKLIRKAIL